MPRSILREASEPTQCRRSLLQVAKKFLPRSPTHRIKTDAGGSCRRIYAPTPMSIIWPVTSAPSKRRMYHRYDQTMALAHIQSGWKVDWQTAYVRTTRLTDAEVTATLPRS